MALLGLSLLALSGCDDGGESPSGAPPGDDAHAGSGSSAAPSSPCPDCSPNPGGETSDIGGSQAACALFTKKTLVDEDEAIALGFDVATLRERAERPIETTLRWLPDEETEAGAPAEGYEPETEVRASITVRSYVYERPDPALCDGTTCRGDDGSGEVIETEQEPCYESVFVGGDVSIETLDGAIRAESLDDLEITGTDSIALLVKYPGAIDDDAPGGTVNIDLTEVQGSLRVFPSVPEPYVGVLYVTFDFAPEQTRGSLLIHVAPDWDAITDEDGTSSVDIPSELSSYAPLSAEWPAH